MSSIKSIQLLSASNQYLSITDALQNGLDLPGDNTFEGWINFKTLTATRLLAKHNGIGVYGYMFELGGQLTPATWGFNHSQNGSNWSGTAGTTTYLFVINTWYHVASVYDASAGKVRLFLNGVFQIEKSGLFNSTFNNTNPFTIGTSWNQSYYFDGKMFDTRVWNVTRTDQEILANYQKFISSSETGLVSNWQYDDNLLDETSNNNDLANNNSATFSTDIPAWAVKKFKPQVMIY